MKQYGIDFQETNSPLVKLNTLRIALAFEVDHIMEFYYYVKMAFLHGILKDEIYMDIAEGIRLEKTKLNLRLENGKTCKLLKFL